MQLIPDGLRCIQRARPSARAGHDMAYDAESDRVILFGGETEPGSNILNGETWAYNLKSNTWEKRTER